MESWLYFLSVTHFVYLLKSLVILFYSTRKILSQDHLIDQVLLTLQVSAQLQLSFRKLLWIPQKNLDTSSMLSAFLTFF